PFRRGWAKRGEAMRLGRPAAVALATTLCEVSLRAFRARAARLHDAASASGPCFSHGPAKTAAAPPSRSTGCWIGTRVPPSRVTPSIGCAQIAPRVWTILALLCEARDEARPLRIPGSGHPPGSDRPAGIETR